MKLCFGTFANVLLMCGTERLKKIELLNIIARSVDSACKLSSNAVTGLLQCQSNLPDGRGNSLGNVVSRASELEDPKTVAEYFSKKVVTKLIDLNKRKLAVLAIREIISRDDSIGDDTVIEIVSGTTKKALLSQSRFVLSDFLAGVFLYTASVDNRIGKEAAEFVTEDFMQSFYNMQETISFIVPQQPVDTTDAAAEALSVYLTNAKEKYNSTTTLLDENPKPFYNIYVPNAVKHTLERSKSTLLDNVTAESLLVLSNFIIIQGVGGLGKSMMMRHLLLDAVNNFHELHLIPVFLTLNQYGASNSELAEFMFFKAAVLSGTITKEIFNDALSNGRFLFLFDGFDEINEEHSTRFERELEDFIDRYPRNHFVLSSRPIQQFVSFRRFCKVSIQPFTKRQSLEFVDKSDFRPEHPEIREKFRDALERTLYHTHRSFAENPLLLTIMLLTFERVANVPSKMHIFYRDAFNALSVTHDATKGAFRRELKTRLNVDIAADYFAEFCFRSYRDMKYEFAEIEFAEYFNKLGRVDRKTSSVDFLYDMCHNLCIMYYEGGKYHFIHRSFQEYFAAAFMSKQNDTFIGKLGNFFEKQTRRTFSNNAFPMLYDMIPDRAEQFIFVPFLTELYDKCDKNEGYWTFLEEMYPVIYYESGDVDDFAVNEPQSYILEFILLLIKYKYILTTGDLPFYDSLVVEEVPENTAPLLVQKKDSEGNIIWQGIMDWPYYELDEDEELPEPEIVGHKLEFGIEVIRKYPKKYAELLWVLENDTFIFKRGYIAARDYLEKLRNKIQERQDDLNDLL